VLAFAEFVFIAYNWLLYCPPIAAVAFAFSGAWVKGEFSIVHAGSALDQPTVGKFFLWTSVMSCLACTIMLLLRAVVAADRRVARRWVNVAMVAILGLVLIELLAPTLLLVQYVVSMGMTLRRFLGLCLALGFWTLLPSAILRSCTASPTMDSRVDMTLSWVLACSLVAPTYYVCMVCRPYTWQHWSTIAATFVVAWVVLVVQGLCAMRLATSRSPSQANVLRVSQ
jgi:hypothetical protein